MNFIKKNFSTLCAIALVLGLFFYGGKALVETGNKSLEVKAQQTEQYAEGESDIVAYISMHGFAAKKVKVKMIKRLDNRYEITDFDDEVYEVGYNNCIIHHLNE